MQLSEWLRAFADRRRGCDNERLLRAAIGFDFRHVAGDLSIVPELTEVVRQASCYARFLGGLAELGSEVPSPLGFRHRLTTPVDIKKDGLLPVQNLARYYAFAGGFTASNTVDRLAAVEQAGARAAMRHDRCERCSSMAHCRRATTPTASVRGAPPTTSSTPPD